MSFTHPVLDNQNIFNLNRYTHTIDYTIEDYDNEINTQINNQIYDSFQNLNIFFLKFNAIMLFLLIHIFVIKIIFSLHKINSSYYIGNLSNREYYPFYINIIQKTNDHKELVLKYLEDESLQNLIRNSINNNSLSFINLKNYFYTRQKEFDEKLFHYGNYNHIKMLNVDNFTTSIGELNYIIWLIESGLLIFFIRRRTLLENKQNISFLSEIKNYLYKFMDSIGTFHNNLILYFENEQNLYNN